MDTSEGYLTRGRQISLAKKGKPQSPKNLLALTIIRNTPEFKAKVRAARLRQVLPVKRTRIELLLQEELLKRGIPFLTNVPIGNMTQADIVLGDQKVAIYCDGCYWHTCPTCGIRNPPKDRRGRDSLITKSLERLGWKVYRFWEHEIEKDAGTCVQRVVEEARTPAIMSGGLV